VLPDRTIGHQCHQRSMRSAPRRPSTVAQVPVESTDSSSRCRRGGVLRRVLCHSSPISISVKHGSQVRRLFWFAGAVLPTSTTAAPGCRANLHRAGTESRAARVDRRFRVPFPMCHRNLHTDTCAWRTLHSAFPRWWRCAASWSGGLLLCVAWSCGSTLCLSCFGVFTASALSVGEGQVQRAYICLWLAQELGSAPSVIPARLHLGIASRQARAATVPTLASRAFRSACAPISHQSHYQPDQRLLPHKKPHPSLLVKLDRVCQLPCDGRARRIEWRGPS
jgi:hypothetical protein